MKNNNHPQDKKNKLLSKFGEKLQENVSLSKYTSSRTGGSADFFIRTQSSDELKETVISLWNENVPFIILGGGSNVLVSDKGVREVVILNRSRSSSRVKFTENEETPSVWADSCVNLGTISRMAAKKGLSGLEWASGIPGTLGGAITGNAGAFGKDIADILHMAEILQLNNKAQDIMPDHVQWPVERFEYEYRNSVIKHKPGLVVVLGAKLNLTHSTPQAVQEKIDLYGDRRRKNQPTGASAGSMFKNPSGNVAGRLIEAAGLKGKRIGDVEISKLHANFFINHGYGTASDIHKLILLAQQRVAEDFGIKLGLEIELLGEW